MSPWFRRRGRRAADGGGAPEPEVEHGPEAEPETEPETEVEHGPEAEPETEPETEVEHAPEPETEPETEVEHAPEPEGAISPTRLDQALDRLRHEIPARDDGSRPAAQ